MVLGTQTTDAQDTGSAFILQSLEDPGTSFKVAVVSMSNTATYGSFNRDIASHERSVFIWSCSPPC
tara:strand:- start:154 stop:351 length:198 start_codon:yes stop_codon:yes gene_type:complete